MPDLGMIFGSKKSAVIGVMNLDASLQETHELTAVATKNEVEDGVDVTDHVKLENPKLTIEGIVSDTPITALSVAAGLALSAAASEASRAVGSPFFGLAVAAGGGIAVNAWKGSMGKTVVSPPRSTKACFDYMVELYQKRQPFSVVTALKKYDNMVITSLVIPKNVKIGRSFQFTVTMEQIRIVARQFVSVPKTSRGDANPNPVAKVGPQSGELPKPTTTTQAETFTLGLWNNIKKGVTNAFNTIKAAK